MYIEPSANPEAAGRGGAAAERLGEGAIEGESAMLDGTLTQAKTVDAEEFFRNVRASVGGNDYAEQIITGATSPVMRWIPTHVDEMGENNVLTAKSVVTSVFQMLVRGYGRKEIAERVRVTVRFVEEVEYSAKVMEAGIYRKKAEADDVFAEREYGLKMTVLDYEKRLYRYWNGVIGQVLAVPRDVDDAEKNAEKNTGILKAWMAMTSVYIYIPHRGLYYAGHRTKGNDMPYWASEIDAAKGFKTMGRAQKVIDNLKRHNPISMRDAQIVNETGEEVTA